MLVNILDNALQVIDKEGEIEITTSYSGESKFITIEIADNGPGISDEDKQKVFLPYFSKKSSGHRPGAGHRPQHHRGAQRADLDHRQPAAGGQVHH